MVPRLPLPAIAPPALVYLQPLGTSHPVVEEGSYRSVAGQQLVVALCCRLLDPAEGSVSEACPPWGVVPPLRSDVVPDPLRGGPGSTLGGSSREVWEASLPPNLVLDVKNSAPGGLPAHRGGTGNEKADELAKAAAEGTEPTDEAEDDYRWETSLSHMSRVATEARSRMTAEWIRSHIGPERRYRPPSGRGLRRKQLRRVRKSVAGRYYQLLSSHAAIDPYLRDKVKGSDSDRCWWCGGGRRQARHRLLVDCRVWAPQARRMWKAIGRACGWKHPNLKAPSVRHLWKDRATEAVLDFLKDTKVGCMVNVRGLSRGERGEAEGEEEGDDEFSEEGGPGSL